MYFEYKKKLESKKIIESWVNTRYCSATIWIAHTKRRKSFSHELKWKMGESGTRDSAYTGTSIGQTQQIKWNINVMRNCWWCVINANAKSIVFVYLSMVCVCFIVHRPVLFGIVADFFCFGRYILCGDVSIIANCVYSEYLHLFSSCSFIQNMDELSNVHNAILEHAYTWHKIRETNTSQTQIPNTKIE